MEQPIRKSLVNKKLIFGAPRSMAGFLWSIASAVVFVGHVWWFLAIAGVIHSVFAWVLSKDPLFFTGISRQLKMPMRRWRV